MKKSNRHKHNERKKRTVSEVKKIHKRAAAETVKKKMHDSAPKWEDLNGLYSQCAQLLTAPAPVALLLRDESLLKAMGSDVKKLHEMATALKTNTEHYRDSLFQIQSKHAGKTGGAEDPTLMITLLGIGEEYQQWIVSFESVVLALVRDIFCLANSYTGSDKPIELTPVDEV